MPLTQLCLGPDPIVPSDVPTIKRLLYKTCVYLSIYLSGRGFREGAAHPTEEVL
jgi:hypothetical protein